MLHGHHNKFVGDALLILLVFIVCPSVFFIFVGTIGALAAFPFIESLYLIAKASFNLAFPNFDKGWLGFIIVMFYVSCLFYHNIKLYRRGE